MRHTPEPIVDVADAIPDFAPLARKTVRLHPRRGECANDASKMGGEFIWPVSEPWPHCEEHDCPYVTVLQLSRSDTPELGFPEHADLFQLLWCPNDHANAEPSYAPASRAFWRRRADIQDALASRPAVGVHDENYVPVPCVLHPERVTEFPDAAEILESFPDLGEKIESCAQLQAAIKTITAYQFSDTSLLYQYWLSVAGGTKVGGYPPWVQDPERRSCQCGHEMDYLLTIASAEFNGGTWGRWLAQEERHVWGGNYDKRAAVQCAPQISLGDMGNLNYFVCRKCDGWPMTAVFQCS
jgi:hypothetical protein